MRHTADVSPIYVAHNTPALVDDKGAQGEKAALDPWYVSGLVEGEGCFCVSFALRPKLRTGLEVRPSFSLSLNERDRGLLRDLAAYFGCGFIRRSRSDRTFKFEVRSMNDLLRRVIPHFERYPLVGCKARSFQGFLRVCRMVEQGNHHTKSGLRDIVAVAYAINVGKRRYGQVDLLKALDEVKG
ncbi:MAG: LAGLIDADG family homing endonuclease [Actinobacteria bacterium]|nr:LAGLIDADG family homing endonuclease [Actinomycetota bacterium]